MRAVKDHHVDRPGVEVRQRMQLTGPNSPIGSISNTMCSNQIQTNAHHRNSTPPHTHTNSIRTRSYDPRRNARGCWMTWWLWRGARTRSHPELGRENPQRPWYCVLRRGRVGRRQVFQQPQMINQNRTTAGWSSPVARQAHNLKVTGSNPVPATRIARQLRRLAGFLLTEPSFQKSTGSTVEARGRVVLRGSRQPPRHCHCRAVCSAGRIGRSC